MSSNDDLDRGRLQPSSSTTTALMLTFRPIIFLLFAAPALVMMMPLVAAMLRVLFGGRTGQHTLLAICTAILFSKVLENSITNAAPTKEIGIESLERSRGSLFFATFAAIIIAIRVVVVPLERVLGLKFFVEWLPSISITSAVRLSCGGFLLGLSVAARYVGPQSIVRCSSSPLLVNPCIRTFQTLFQSTRYTPTAIPQKNNTNTPISEHYEINPRRLQLPTSAALFVQMVISVLVGVSLAFVSVLPSDYNASLSTISLPCITSNVLQLLFTTIYGTNHEIDPKKYQSHCFGNQVNIIKSMSTIVPICYAVLAICIHFKSGLIQWSDYIVYFICLPPAIVFYLHIFDYALKILICSTPSNLRKVVEEASGGDASVEILIDVILRSLLHSNDDLVKILGRIPLKSSIWMDLEEEELKLNDTAMKTMAKTLLHKTSEDEASPRLEDDILRLAIVSCIGGPVSKDEGTLGDHTGKNISHRLKSVPNDKATREYCTDPYAVPIVRALCVYIGGFGEALQFTTVSESRILSDALVLPPGALFTCECALRGASYWIIESISLPRISTSVAILIPVLLNATYRLEQGLLQHQKASNRHVFVYQSPVESNNNLKQLSRTRSVSFDDIYDSKLYRTTSPQLWPLYNLCNDCVRTILETAKSSEGFCRLSFLESLDIDCKKWLQSKTST